MALVIERSPAKCCWCHEPLKRIVYDGRDPLPWMCTTPACWQRIFGWSITTEKRTRKGVTTGEVEEWLFCPTPKQVEFFEQTCLTKNTGFGGSAAVAKSHGLRWGLYYWCARIPGLTCLLLRRTFPELETTHLMQMPRDAAKLAPLAAQYVSGAREFRFGHDALIKAGHCETQADVAKYLSTEWDIIAFDELVTFERDAALEIMTRARTSKAAVIQQLRGAQVWAGTNPGGRGAIWVKEFFLDRAPDPERYPGYDPSHWGFVQGRLEDNPYIEAGYRQTLMNLPPIRRRQLLDGDWNAFEGQVFDFQADKDGRPWHVADLGIAA